MCTNVMFNGKDIECVGDLRAAIGEDLVWNAGYKGWEDYVRAQDRDPNEFCLCPVDISASAEAHGLRAKEVDFDPSCFELIARTPSPASAE